MATNYSDNMTADAARVYYSARGLEPIPIPRMTKAAVLPGWNTLPIDALWASVSTAGRGNIGLRHTPTTYAARQFCAVDLDEHKQPGTIAAVQARLDGLGVSPVVVRTASGIGRRVYLRIQDVPADIGKRNLSADIGAGEFYARAGQTIAPCSVVQNDDGSTGTYALIAGSWDTLPSVAWHDMAWIVSSHTHTARAAAPGAHGPRVYTPGQLPGLPIPLPVRDVPHVRAMFDASNAAGPGGAVTWKGRVYSTRSEFDMRIVGALILAGWPYADIRAAYAAHSQKWLECADADAYLALTYAEAVQYIAVTGPAADIRQRIVAEYTRAHWDADMARGRSGAIRKRVYLSVLADAYAAGSVQPTVSTREAAEYAAVKRDTAGRAIRWLMTVGLLGQDGGYHMDAARTLVIRLPDTLPADTPGPVPPPSGHTELWRAVRGRGLGPSAQLVYAQLTDTPATVRAIAATSGKHRNTVAAALRTLSDERVQLAAQLPDGWVRGPGSLDAAARKLRCDTRAARRRAEHDAERERTRAAVARHARDTDKQAGPGAPAAAVDTLGRVYRDAGAPAE